MNITKINGFNAPVKDTPTDFGNIQVLYGGTGAQLALAIQDFTTAVYTERFDGVDADVWFDDAFNHYFTHGITTGKIELAQTQSANDSLHIYDVITQWGEEQTETVNLLQAWNQYNSGEEEKFFRFKTADDTYKVPQYETGGIIAEPGDLGNTPAGTLNIAGVSETAEDGTVKRSTIDMDGASGFNLAYHNTKMNLSNVTIKNA